MGDIHALPGGQLARYLAEVRSFVLRDAQLTKNSWAQTELFSWLQATVGMDDIERAAQTQSGWQTPWRHHVHGQCMQRLQVQTSAPRQLADGSPGWLCTGMNNYLVAQKYADAQQQSVGLDDTLDFVLTWRMRPTPVKLRLLASPEMAMQFLLIKRL